MNSQTHCKRGHSLADCYHSKTDNYITRRCKICHAKRVARWQKKNRKKFLAKMRAYHRRIRRLERISVAATTDLHKTLEQIQQLETDWFSL